jgi:lipid-binding SYLF domain-containing protein
MHRFSALLPSWDRSRHSAPPAARTIPAATPNPAKTTPGALDKVFGWAEKIVPAAVNRNSTFTAAAAAASTRYGRETYWPTSLDKECDKAARIIKSFCCKCATIGVSGREGDGLTEAVDGFLSQEIGQTEQTSENTTESTTPTYVTKKIPPRIIQNAVGLAVFSCMRSGLWMSGSGGAGLITARKADGTWSPPSAIILHTAEMAFEMGVDIYDCVLVINSVQTLELFTRPRLILGADASLAVGPLVADGAKDPEIKWKEISETVLTYVKARGKHQAVQLDGSLVTERVNENEKFYCAGVTILDILAGNIPKHVPEMRPLFEVIKAAEGRSDYDKALMDWLAQQPAPGDAEIEPSPRASTTSPTKQVFGVLDSSDPDPFGIIGLEMAGIEIREAGTKTRPTSTQFGYQPNPTSPIYGRFSRQSIDTFVSRSNRGSGVSARTQATAATDACTQTDVASTVDTAYSRANSDDGKVSVERLPTVAEPDEVDYTKVDMSIIERLKRRTMEPVAPEPAPAVEAKEVKVTTEVKTITEVKTAKEKPNTIDQAVGTDTSSESPSPRAADERDEDADDEEDEDEDDELIICEVATASTQPARTSIQRPQVTQVIQAKGAIVTIPKRVPPPLPARSPARASRGSRSDFGDVSSLRSPIRNSFLSIESRAEDAASPADVTSMDEAFATPDRIPTHIHRPVSPRHAKNSSSVCTTVAVDTTVGARTSLSNGETDKEKLSPQTLEPTSSESDREPTTPQTAETDFDTASEHQAEGKGVGKAAESVRIVSLTPTESNSEREKSAAALSVLAA